MNLDVEMIKSAALTVAIVDFVAYVFYVWGRYGIQSSISISFYDWDRDDRWLFRGFVWILSGAIIFSGIGWGNPIFFVSGSLLSLVGFFTKIKVKWKYVIHMIGAIGGISVCYLGILYMNILVGLAAIGLTSLQILILIFVSKRQNMIWNAEITFFMYLIAGLLYVVNF